METLAILSIVLACVALLALLWLHVKSPEFAPSWRMISEYALGKHKWLITLFFYCWGASSIVLAILGFQLNGNGWLVCGVALLLISGIGAVMGGMFDVRHNLHGLSFTLGVPTLIAASLLVSYQLSSTAAMAVYRTELLVSAHLTWISCLTMAVSMVIMISGFKKAGVPMGPNIEPPSTVPPGVLALAGYANRFLVLCYVGWNILLAIVFLKTQ